MRAEGLEPPSLAAPGPKPGVSASFTTPAASRPSSARATGKIVRSFDDGGTRRRRRAPEPEEGLLEGDPAGGHRAAARLRPADDRDLDRRVGRPRRRQAAAGPLHPALRRD